jgi:hypothetical protein
VYRHGNEAGCDDKSGEFIGKFEDFRDLDGNEFLNEEIRKSGRERGGYPTWRGDVIWH